MNKTSQSMRYFIATVALSIILFCRVRPVEWEVCSHSLVICDVSHRVVDYCESVEIDNILLGKWATPRSLLLVSTQTAWITHARQHTKRTGVEDPSKLVAVQSQVTLPVHSCDSTIYCVDSAIIPDAFISYDFLKSILPYQEKVYCIVYWTCMFTTQ